jgi:hypothetical protein
MGATSSGQTNHVVRSRFPVLDAGGLTWLVVHQRARMTHTTNDQNALIKKSYDQKNNWL